MCVYIILCAITIFNIENVSIYLVSNIWNKTAYIQYKRGWCQNDIVKRRFTPRYNRFERLYSRSHRCPIYIFTCGDSFLHAI
jgi:hypothetical protein